MTVQQRNSGLIISPQMARMENIFIDGRTLGYAAAENSNTALQTTGNYSDQMLDTTAASNLDADGRFLQQDSAAAIGSGAAGTLLKFAHRRELNYETLHKFALLQTTDIRFFAVTLDTLGILGFLGSDTPANAYVGVRYSTGAGDTSFRFVSSDGVLTNNIDSGIAISTNTFYIHIHANNSIPNYTVQILDDAFAGIASTIFTTNIPASGIDMAIGVGLVARAAAIKSLKQYFWVGVNKK